MTLSRRAVLAAAVTVSLYPSLGARAKTRFEKDAFIETIQRANRGPEPQAAVQEVLERAMAMPSDIVNALGTPSKAGLHTLYKNSQLTIINVVWAPMMVLFPHDHRMWATIGVYGGREDNIIWTRKGEAVTATGAASLSTGDVFSLPHDAVHSVVNPIEKLTGAIHVYGGDFFQFAGRSRWDLETLQRKPLELEDTKRSFERAAERFDARRSES